MSNTEAENVIHGRWRQMSYHTQALLIRLGCQPNHITEPTASKDAVP